MHYTSCKSRMVYTLIFFKKYDLGLNWIFINFKNDVSIIFIWESCVFMDQYGNNIVFGTQVCESRKTSVNVETYIRFMHSEPAVFFLPKLPLQVSTSAAHLSTGWNWTGCFVQNQILSFSQKHPGRPTVHPPFLSFGTHSSHLSAIRHQGEAEVPTRKP